MKRFLLFVWFVAASLFCKAATITGPIYLTYSNRPYTGPILIRPLSTPLPYTPNLVTGGDFKVSPDTNGLFSVDLQPGNYRVTIGADRPFVIDVPTNAATYTLLERITNALSWNSSILPYTNVNAIALTTRSGTVKATSDQADPVAWLTNDFVNLNATLNYGTFNPRHYGAKGDGTTDDTIAWTNALYAASLVKGTVLAPPGTYIVSGITIPQWVTVRGHAQPGEKNAGEGGTVLKLKSGSSGVDVVTATAECSIHNIQIDGNKSNVTGTSRGLFFNASGTFKESDIQNVTVVNCKSDGIYIDAHEIKLINVSALYNDGRGIYVDDCYDVMLDHILCGWNGGNGFEAGAGGATMRIQQLDSYYNQGSGAVFHSPFWTYVARLQCDYNFKDGLEIDVSTTSTYIDIYHPLIYGSNVDQDNFGNLNSAASGTYSDVRISGTQYPKNVRITGNKIGLSTASTKKPQYHITWSNSQSGVGFNCTFQDIDVDTSSGSTTSTGKSTPDTFLTSGSWTGRLFNHRDGSNVRTITRNSLFYHTWDGSTTPSITVFNDYNFFVKSNVLAYGYVAANSAVYSGRGLTSDKTGVQIKSDTGEAFGLSSVGDSFYIGSDVDSTPLLRGNGTTGEWTVTTTLANTSGSTKAWGVDYTINQTSGTGSSLGISVNATETAKGSGSHRLLQLATGGTPRFYVQTDGRPIVVSPNGTSGMLLRGDGSTDSQILFNYAATLDRRLTLAGNSINVTDAAGSAANSLSLQPSGGTTVLGGSLTFGSGGPIETSGSGSPEGVITAGVGSVYHRTGGGASTSLYVKESGTGNTGWVAYGAAGSGGVTDGDKGDITASSSGTVWTIDNSAVTYAKMQNVSATSRLLGRNASTTGPPEEITLGSGLSMSGTTLSVTGGGTGDVVGPASATDNAIARFDLTTGKLIQNSAATIADTTGDITAGKYNGVSISGSSTPTLAVTGTTTVSGANTGDQTITLSGDVTGSGTSGITATIANSAVSNAKMANMSASTIKARITGSTGAPEDATFTQLLDLVGSAAQGDILYRGASTWTRLGAGTSGQFLKTQGTGANPLWASVPGGGDALTSNPLSQFASTTSSQLAGVLSNESGTGLAVFNDGATITNSTINGIDIRGTAGSTLNVGTGGTLGTAAYTASSAYQATDAEITALAGLTSAADKVPYFTGAGTAAIADFTASGRTVVSQSSVKAVFDAINGAEATVASATTTDIGAASSDKVSITGTTTITGFGTATAGIQRKGRFTGALTLTHNATSLILPGGANITTVAGDRFEAVSLGSGNWVVYNYTTATRQGSGAQVFATSPTLTTPVLGVATATSVNKVAITAPATSATLTIADGKTATVNNSITFAGTDSTTMTFPSVSASIGYLGIPQGSKSADYTLVLADAGTHIFHPSSDANSRTFTIPANGSVAFPVGTAVTFYNASANSCTIAITTDTLRKAGTGTTGSVTLPQYAMATALKVTTTEWVISGNGI